MTFRSLVLALISLIAFRSGTASAALPFPMSRQPCQFVSSMPFNITAPGRYCLNADITGAQGILIREPNGLPLADVLLDCMGHEIAVDHRARGTTGVATLGEMHNVTIQNCKISNFDRGIYVGSAMGQDIHVLNNHVDNSISVGIMAGGNGLHVIGNHVTKTLGASGWNTYGIVALPYETGISATGQMVMNNLVAETVSDLGAIGISVIGSTSPQIFNNQILGLETGNASNAWLVLDDDGQGANTSGAKVINNVGMTRAPAANGGIQGLAYPFLCVGNTTIGFSSTAFDSCISSRDNTVIP